MKDLYYRNRLRKNKTLNGTFTIPKTPLKESTTGGKIYDWDAYHLILKKKHKKLGLKTKKKII
jgi:hypothetical protein